MNSQNFYADLPPLTEFINLATPDHYTAVPDDWYVLITDIVGSTQAIAAGKYKDVNLMGAASIIAVLNVVRPLEIPFIFGGDGATLLVPSTVFGVAREALLGVKAIARESFAMDLRVGAVPVAEIRQQCALRVAKFRLFRDCCQASFMGGGITYATKLIKQDSRYQLTVEGSPHQANLEGLECRWQEVSSPHGKTVSLIVSERPHHGMATGETYQAVLQAIRSIYGDGESYHPIAHAPLKLSFNPFKLAAEIKARSPVGTWNRLKYLGRVLLENLLGALFMGLALQIGQIAWGRYKSEVCAMADYQKIDDTLMMVISGNQNQIDQLSEYLERRYREGYLVYGLKVSSRALLTCVILDRRNNHVHFIDGAEGGYALAAKALKSRLQQLRQASATSDQGERISEKAFVHPTSQI